MSLLILPATHQIDRARALLLTAALAALLATTSAGAQQWGQSSGPAWGQAGTPAWGQYQGTIGASGWQFNQTLKRNEPNGALLNPNQIGGGAGASIFTPRDTRLLGRNAP